MSFVMLNITTGQPPRSGAQVLTHDCNTRRMDTLEVGISIKILSIKQ